MAGVMTSKVQERRLHLILRIGRYSSLAGPGRAGPGRAGRDACDGGAACLEREAVSTWRGVDAPATH